MGATGMLELFMGMPDTPENRAKFVSTIPLGRLVEPEDIAKAAALLRLRRVRVRDRRVPAR